MITIDHSYPIFGEEEEFVNWWAEFMLILKKFQRGGEKCNLTLASKFIHHIDTDSNKIEKPFSFHISKNNFSNNYKINQTDAHT